jgi:hypothetical protein
VCHGLLRDVAYARQSVSTEWSYHKLCSDTVHTRVQSEQKFIVYIVTMFYKTNMSIPSFMKKLRANPLEFRI